MSLQFVVRINRKAPARIGVLRVRTDDRKITGYDNLGTLKQLDTASLIAFSKEKKLDDQEQYQLENYAANLTFNQTEFHANPEQLQREFIYFAPEYEEALRKLWKMAKKHNIPFCPLEIQHNALLHKAKAIERKLNEILKKPVNILAKLDVDIRRFDEKEFNRRADKSSQVLFELVLTLKQPLEQLCEEFKSIAQGYNKNASLKPHYFKNYADNLKRLPLWYNTVAIDLLMQHGINPTKSLPIEKIAEYWVRLRKENFTFEEACKQFKQEFNVSEKENIAREAIKRQYEEGISTANS